MFHQLQNINNYIWKLSKKEPNRNYGPEKYNIWDKKFIMELTSRFVQVELKMCKIKNRSIEIISTE